jgi:hypothetical protein
MPKKSPTGTSTDGSVSSSQYIRRIEHRQFPVGVIQMCWITPDPLISASVKVAPALIRMLGLTFQPWPRLRAAFLPVPSVAMPPLPLSPVKFSGLIDLVSASESRNRLCSPVSMPLNFVEVCACASATTSAAAANIAVEGMMGRRFMAPFSPLSSWLTTV